MNYCVDIGVGTANINADFMFCFQRIKYKKIFCLTLCFLLAFFVPLANASDIFYIKNIDGTIYCNKNSWPDKTSGSSPDINTLINNNVKNLGDEAYIAAGVYNVNGTINLKAGVKLYGGFADDNSENTPDERKFDGVTSLDAGGKCRVIICQDTNADNDNTRLDGFIITGGKDTKGGGMYNKNASPTIANCVFVKNNLTASSSPQGGAIYNDKSQAKIINCSFIENLANFGGAIYNLSSGVIIINCTFKENNASKAHGGAIYHKEDRALTLINCSFIKNSAIGSTSNGGAIYTYDANLIIKNCAFIDNTAKINGAEIYNHQITNSLNHEITNTIIYHNDDKNIIYNNNINNTINFKNCAINDAFKIIGGTVESSDNIYLTSQDIFELKDERSECGITHAVLKFNKGSRLVNSGAPCDVNTDQLGNERGLKTDIGSFEY